MSSLSNGMGGRWKGKGYRRSNLQGACDVASENLVQSGQGCAKEQQIREGRRAGAGKWTCGQVQCFERTRAKAEASETGGPGAQKQSRCKAGRERSQTDTPTQSVSPVKQVSGRASQPAAAEPTQCCLSGEGLDSWGAPRILA